MSTNLFGKATLAVLTTIAALSVNPQTRAAGPTPVIRTFAFFRAGTTVPPSFLSDDSTVVTVLPATQGQTGTFLFSVLPHKYADTVWNKNPAHHSVKNGVALEGVYFWLETLEAPTPPPIGAHTFTGTDSPFVVSEQLFHIAVCANSVCDRGEDSSKYYFTTPVTGTPFVVVTAIFSK